MAFVFCVWRIFYIIIRPFVVLFFSVVTVLLLLLLLLLLSYSSYVTARCVCVDLKNCSGLCIFSFFFFIYVIEMKTNSSVQQIFRIQNWTMVSCTLHIEQFVRFLFRIRLIPLIALISYANNSRNLTAIVRSMPHNFFPDYLYNKFGEWRVASKQKKNV